MLRRYAWSAGAAAAAIPFVLTVCHVLWHTPFPLTEAVAIFEDVANRPALRFVVPETSYYRPLFHLTMSAIWNSDAPLDSRLGAIKLIQIGAVILLFTLLLWHLRPRRMVEAIAAMAAIAVLGGGPGLVDNLELPLSYTTVGMPMALLAWLIAIRRPAPWHLPALLVVTAIAIGFKEQGLVIVPVLLAAWWMRAPGVSTRAALVLIGFAAGYVALRLAWRAGPLFEQAVGFGFSELTPAEAELRFGDFPYGIYAYNGLSTIANVLFSEPTRGIFRNVHALVEGRLDIWQGLQTGSSAAMTVLIAWWGVGAVRRTGRREWSLEAGLFVALLAALVACGVLSFNYSRDRLGGMALVFYALAAFFAVRAAADRLPSAPRVPAVAAGLVFAMLIVAWQSRLLTTLEVLRYQALVNQRQWTEMLPARRVEFAERPTYLSIMNSMITQGLAPSAPRRTRYPAWVSRTLGLP